MTVRALATHCTTLLVRSPSLPQRSGRYRAGAAALQFQARRTNASRLGHQSRGVPAGSRTSWSNSPRRRTLAPWREGYHCVWTHTEGAHPEHRPSQTTAASCRGNRALCACTMPASASVLLAGRSSWDAGERFRENDFTPNNDGEHYIN